jgi:flagellar biosynthesis/type III secretory pathway protein FliH
MNESIGMPWKIGEAFDKLKFSGWNSSDQQIYEGEVQEVITYFDELECMEMKGLKKGLERGIRKGIEKGVQHGLQRGRVEEQIKSLMERFFDDESLEKPLQRITKHSLAEEWVQEVWSRHGKKGDVSPGKNLENFLQLLRGEGILDE